MILFHEMSRPNRQIHRNRKWISGCLQLRWGREWNDLGVMVKGYETSFRGNENVLKLIVALVAQSCVYAESHWIIYFKRVNCIVCEL